MPELDGQRAELAHNLRDALARENLLTRQQARVFVRCLQTSWNVEAINWSVADSRKQLADARRLLHAASIFKEVDSQGEDKAKGCYRRAAELLEWLARGEDELSAVVPLGLLAAASFQLAGLPAMAAGILRQISRSEKGWVLLSHFLRADFDSVLQLSAEFWGDNPDLTTAASPRTLLSEDADDRISWYITTELIRCISLIALSLRGGNDSRLATALQKLEAIERLASRSAGEDAALLVTLMKLVAQKYDDATVYKPLRQLADIDPSRSSQLDALARRQYDEGRGILWASQQMGLQRLLDNSSFALCTPTGSGKTLVANLALVKELLLLSDSGSLVAPLALYLVPSRALAGEVESKLSREMGQEFIVTGLYGGSDWGVTDYWLHSDRPTILIATVEKADALMRYLGPFVTSRLKLLILDEAHQVVPDKNLSEIEESFATHSERTLRLEGFVARLFAQTTELSCVALTAVAGGAAGPVARWVEGREDAQPIGLNYRSTRQVIGRIKTRAVSAPIIEMDLMNGVPLEISGSTEVPYINLRTEPMPQLPAKMRDSLNRFNQTDVLWTSLQLAGSDRRILISLPQQPEQTMGWFCDALDLPSWTDVAAEPQVSNEASQQILDEAIATCVDYCGEDSYELKLLKSGIATSHGQMPQRLRRLMNLIIERGICPITLATATLTEGVNLPFDIVFLVQLKRTWFDPEDGQQSIPVSTAEFRNLAGRVGRPGIGRSMEGLVLVPLPQSPSSTAQSKVRAQRRQARQFQDEYDDLLKRLSEEEKAEDVHSPIGRLFEALFAKARDLLDIVSVEEFLAWLENAAPSDVSADAGKENPDPLARLADSLDELDGVLISAIEELNQITEEQLSGAEAEARLKRVWGNTFTAFAAATEDWLEDAFVTRGRALVETVYPDREQRRVLYQYGYPPFLGTRFQDVSGAIFDVLAGASEYGTMDGSQRSEMFASISSLVAQDKGYGFSVRDSATALKLLDNWRDVLDWWLQSPDTPGPEPDELRSWQAFVSTNLEFRLGVAIGGVVAAAWAGGATDALAVPSLEQWKETTGLPWFGFWARELLRWGTHDPFVAFSLSQGISKTRVEGAQLKGEYVAWLNINQDAIEPEDFIDPQLYLKWQQSLSKPAVKETALSRISTNLTGTNGSHGSYPVIPVRSTGALLWLDAAGYELGKSDLDNPEVIDFQNSDDFELVTGNENSFVQRVFRGRRR